jgi:uncharacterized membrane protein YoaK (UPF0700 family)
LLAALAGWVDAAGLTDSGRVFISFMSGNTTNFAVSLTHRDWVTAGSIAAVVALFVIGVAAGETLERAASRHGRSLVLALEALFLASGAALHDGLSTISSHLTLYPLVCAMGLQNATMHRAGGISIGLTYVTGTLVQIGRTLASFPDPDARRRFRQYLALWLSLAAGAAAGALALSISPLIALSCAATAAATLAMATAQRPS